MNRINRREPKEVQRNSLRPRYRYSIVFCVIVFGTSLNAPVRGASVSASLQVRARIVSSCRVSTNSLQSAVNTREGRFNCPTSDTSSTAANGAAHGVSANYTVSDAPGTGGAVKILTLVF